MSTNTNERKTTLRTLIDSEAALNRWMENAHPPEERLGWRVGQILGATTPFIGPKSDYRTREHKLLSKHAKWINGTGWVFPSAEARVAFDAEIDGLLDEEVTLMLPMLLSFDTINKLHIEPKPTPKEQFVLTWLIDPSDVDAPKSANPA